MVDTGIHAYFARQSKEDLAQSTNATAETVPSIEVDELLSGEPTETVPDNTVEDLTIEGDAVGASGSSGSDAPSALLVAQLASQDQQLTLHSLAPICVKCGTECDPFKAQLKSKCGGKLLCNICNSRHTQLSRACVGRNASRPPA